MTWFSRFGTLLIAAAALASACSVNEAGNIPCGDNTNCPPAYPTCGSRSVCVASAAAAKLEVVTGDKQSAISGSQLAAPLVVRVLDTNGNPVQGFVIAWSASAASSVSVASTTTGPDGKAQVLGTIAKKNGTTTFTATATGLAGSPLALTAAGVSGPAAKLVGVAGADQTAVAGSALPTPLGVLVTDVNDNPVVGATVTWSSAAGGGSVVLASTNTIADGTATTTALLGTVVGSNAYVATASNGSTALSGSPVTFNATGAAGVAAHFVLSGPSATVAGVVQNYTLTAQDSNGNIAVGYRGTATISSNDSNAALPAAHAFTVVDAGILHFTAILKTAGTRSVTAIDGNLSASIPSISVSPAAAASFAVSNFPTPSAATATNSFSVTALDAFGNVAVGYQGTVNFSSLDQLPTFVPTTYAFKSTDAGVAGGFTAKLSRASSGTDITVTDAGNAAISGAQTGIVITPGAAVSITVAGFPSPVGAGFTGGAVLVTVKDTFGNTASGYRGTVHFNSDNASKVLPSDYPFTSGDLGSKAFPVTLNTASATATFFISVTDTLTPSIAGSQTGIHVDPAPAVSLSVTSSASSTVAGAALTSVTVTAKDTFGNTVTGYAGTVHFTSSDSQATASLPVDSALPGGSKSFSGITFKTAGAQTITAKDIAPSSTITGTSSTITVTAAATTAFIVSAQGSTQTAGAPFNLVVTAKDTYGNNTGAAYTGTVHFTSSDPLATPGSGLPADTTLVSGTATLLTTLETAGTQTVTATDGGITGSSGNVTVNPASTSKFIVAASTSQTAGVSFSVTVTAQDIFGNTTPSYAGTVLITSSDGAFVPPASSTLTSGSKVFTGAVLKTAGSQTVIATDSVSSGLHGTSAPITVSPAAASTLLVSTSAGSPQTAGVAFDVTATAKDPFGNVATGYAGTVHFTSTDGTATAGAGLPANSTLPSGTKTFTAGATLKTAGAQTITATDAPNSINGTSASITVGPAGINSFSFAAIGAQTAGTSFSFTVTAKDAFSNTATGYAGTVHFTSTDGTATSGAGLPADATLTAGTGTFSATLKTAPSQTITAKDTPGTATGTTAAITVNPSTATTLTVQASSPQTAAIAFNVTVTAKDTYGNTATGYGGTVHLSSSSDGQAVSPLDSILTSGAKVFSFTLKTAGTQTVTAADTVTGSITGTTGSITVNVGAASTFTVVAASPQVSGNAFNVAVTAKDAGGNTVTTYSSVVNITSTDLAAVLPGGSTLTSGTKNFPVTLNTAGAQTVTATQSGGAISATSAVITVNPGATSKLVISTHPNSVVAGFANSITVTAEDAASNVTPAYAGTIVFSTNNTGTLPGNFTFVPGTDNGVHTFVGGVTLTTPAVASATISVNDGTFTTAQNSITVVPAPLFFQGTATLLVGGSRAGQIFIAGGTSVVDTAANATSNTYFYNPGTGGMLPGPAMQTARYAHTATATTLGQVVIAGGPFGSNSDFEFEVCSTDGNTPSCASVTGAAKNSGRCNAAAALVTSSPTYRVIVAGGDTCGSATALLTWSVWDSSTPTATTPNGSGNKLTIGRRLHTASAVGSGVVLFAGGTAGQTADLFNNNATVTSSTVVATTGAMNAPRSSHTATLITTGTAACLSGPCVLLAGGNGGAGLTWEIYDQTSKTFPRHASGGNDLLVPGRKQHVAASFSNGKIQLAGGTNGSSDQKSTEAFDPATQSWGAGLDMGITRNRPAGAYATQNLLLVVGGNLTAPSIEATTPPP